MAPDHYQVLGVVPSASADELRAAYHRVMRDTHPDRRPGDAAAEDAARRAIAAWSVLRSPARRRAYDEARGYRRPVPATGVVARAPRAQVYSPEQHAYRRAFSAACAKVAAGVFVAGLAALLTSLG